MRRNLAILLAISFALLPILEPLAYCGSGAAIYNASTAAFSGLSGTVGDVRAQVWFYAKGVPANPGGAVGQVVNVTGCCYQKDDGFDPASCNTTSPLVGCDFGTKSTTAGDVSGLCAFSTNYMLHQLQPGGGFCTGGPYAAGYYAVNTNWNQAGFDGCPNNSAGGDRVIIVAEDTTGYFGLISKMPNGADWLLDSIGTYAVIPKPSISTATVTGHPDSSHTTLSIGWTALTLAQAKGGFATGEDPGSSLVSSYKVYYYESAAGVPPTNLDRTAWIYAGTTTADYTTNSANITIPNAATGNQMYLALSLVFDSGFESFFVSPTPYGAQIGPTPAGVFASVSATQDKGRVTANWRTNTETGVAFFEVWSATSAGGPFAAVDGTRTAPKGSNSSYSVTFRLPPSVAKSYTTYVKIKDQDTNGEVHWSDVVKAVPPASVAPPAAETPVKEPMKRVK